MKRRVMRASAFVLVLFAALFPARAATAVVIVDLGALLAGTDSRAQAVNDSGQVVGFSSTVGDALYHAFSWTQAGGMSDLGTIDGDFFSQSQALAVNASGQVVGWSYIGGEFHAFSWTQTGGMLDLGTFGGLYSQAVAVNASGQVVGYSDTAGNAGTHAFLWTQADGMLDLGTLGGTSSQAVAVNASGQVVGYSDTAGNAGTHAFLWTQADGMLDLGTLGGTSSQAVAVNASGQVVGYSDTAGNAGTHAFSWTQADGMIHLDTPGTISSGAVAVNDIGQVVGTSLTAIFGYDAFSWTQAGGMIDLGTLGGKGSDARAVNASGQVVGTRHFELFKYHAFSWTQADGMLDLGPPVGTYSDAAAVNASGQVVGYADTANGRHAVLWSFAARQLTALSDAHFWIGLKNSDDQGTQFDLKVEALKNNREVVSGLKRCITGVTRNPSLAKEVIVSWDAFSGVPVASGDLLSLRVSIRIGTNPNGTKCAGAGGSHNNAVGLRLYYDSTSRSSRFDATITPASNENLYLHAGGNPCPNGNGQSTTSSLFLDDTEQMAPNAKCKDSGVINFNGGNPFSLIGTWNLAALP